MEVDLRPPSISRAGAAPGGGVGASSNAVPAAILAIGFAAGSAIALASLIGLIGQSRALQFGVFVVGFGVLLPLASLLAIRLGAAPASAAERLRSAALTVGLAMVVLLCAMRLSGIGGLMTIRSAPSGA